MQRVLFIDLRNTCCSQIAEGWFNLYAQGWGEARSCGTRPASRLDVFAAIAMAEAGIDIRRFKPKTVNQKLLTDSDFLIIIGSEIDSSAFHSTQVWDFSDPDENSVESYRLLRNAICRRVEEFIMEINPESKSSPGLDPTLIAVCQAQMIIEGVFFR